MLKDIRQNSILLGRMTFLRCYTQRTLFTPEAMRVDYVPILLAAALLFGCVSAVDDRTLVGDALVSHKDNQWVIAHRGASGYLPEHTLAAKAMAYAQGADFIEQDLVMTKDNQVIVLHDYHLDTVTNVADLYPGRARSDGRYYVVDFTLAEIRRLAVSERFVAGEDGNVAVFGGRFPVSQSSFRVNTFAEEIELIHGLNKSTGRIVGIYPEIKNPAFHRSEGKDISTAVLDILKQYGYSTKQDSIFLQSFDAIELQRIHDELFPAMNMNIQIVQLLGTSDEFRPALTIAGLTQLAAYADGIGPSIDLIVDKDSIGPRLEISPLVNRAHELELVVHPYTFRQDELPGYVKNYQQLLTIFLDEIAVDGVFTDFPDLTREYIETRQ